jgi:hypothetical protein
LQIAMRTFAFLVFAITLLVLRGGTVRTLGIVFVAAALSAQIVRLLACERDDGSRLARWPLFR